MKIRIATAGALLLGIVSGSTAQTPYSQPWDFAPTLRASQYDPNSSQLIGTTYDNFTYSAPTMIQSVCWTGGYFNPVSQGTILGFTLSLYFDSGNDVGPLFWQTYITGNAGESVVATVGGITFYDYHATIPSLPVTAGTYWLSVVPDLVFPPQWGWANSAVGDNLAYQDFAGSHTAYAEDMAFTLNCDPVPEPVTMSLAAAGLGMAVRRRARRAR